MGTSWVHHGYIMGTLWVHHGYIMDILWVHYGYIMGTSWIHHAYIMGTFVGSVALCSWNHWMCNPHLVSWSVVHASPVDAHVLYGKHWGEIVLSFFKFVLLPALQLAEIHKTWQVLWISATSNINRVLLRLLPALYLPPLLPSLPAQSRAPSAIPHLTVKTPLGRKSVSITSISCLFFLFPPGNHGSFQQELAIPLLFPIRVSLRILDASTQGLLPLRDRRKLHWRWLYADEKHLPRPCIVPGVYVLPMVMGPTRTHSPVAPTTSSSRRTGASCESASTGTTWTRTFLCRVCDFLPLATRRPTLYRRTDGYTACNFRQQTGLTRRRHAAEGCMENCIGTINEYML